jgi:hypothetical protein
MAAAAGELVEGRGDRCGSEARRGEGDLEVRLVPSLNGGPGGVFLRVCFLKRKGEIVECGVSGMNDDVADNKSAARLQLNV